MVEGTVVRFEADKGFGLIESDGIIYFASWNDIKEEGKLYLNVGDKVTFIPVKSSRTGADMQAKEIYNIK